MSSPTPVDFNLKTRPTAIYRPRSLDSFHNARLRSLRDQVETKVEWDIIHTDGPDVENLHTLAQLGRMSGNAYALPGQNNWYEIDPTWNISFPFGYEDPQDGFRGHLFFSSDNSTIVLSIKGTTLQGPTSKKDKFNDNLLFSCCCARVDLSWIFNQVCDCYARNWRCDNSCLSEALIEESLFYTVGVNLIADIQKLYPSANLWLTGHSLGGALASLLGSTFGLPAVTFESPGERLAAQRLHLPVPADLSPSNDDGYSAFSPSLSPAIHVYHTADPIPQGACTGPFSPCARAGYALETHCHLGKSIVFDTVGRLGWRVDIRRHPIREVIEQVLEGNFDWGEDRENMETLDIIQTRREVPEAREEVGCVDCFKWEFGDFKNKD